LLFLLEIVSMLPLRRPILIDLYMRSFPSHQTESIPKRQRALGWRRKEGYGRKVSEAGAAKGGRWGDDEGTKKAAQPACIRRCGTGDPSHPLCSTQDAEVWCRYVKAAMGLQTWVLSE
jgi:hypothetical protein